jgi:hypothetical protein
VIAPIYEESTLFEYAWTRDAHRDDYEGDQLIGWTRVAVPPPGVGWEIADSSKDTKTLWRRVRREYCGGRHGR